MKFDDSNITRIEYEIKPATKEVITIPAGDPLDGIAIYVASSAFVFVPSKRKELLAIARLVAAAPKLLEALKAILADFKEAYDRNPEATSEWREEIAPESWTNSLRLANIAVAKVEERA